LGVQIGSGATTICTQTEDKLRSIIRSDAGVGQALAPLLKKVPLEKIHRWLPFDMTLEDLHNQLLNKALHPDSLPSTYEDLMIEYAVAREALRLVIEQARAGWPLQPAIGLRNIHWNLIIGAGLTLNQTPQQGTHAAMLMLDGLEPWGVTSLALDRNGAASLLGVIATIQPEAAVTVTAQDAFLNLGTVIAPAGHGQAERPALNYKIVYQDESTAEGEVPYGAIELVALPSRQKATLEIHPTRHFDIGLGQPGRGAIVSEVEGGPLGIIIDARGRPLKLPRDDEHRRQQLEQWFTIFNDTYATPKENH
jgi:hypothetical protein